MDVGIDGENFTLVFNNRLTKVEVLSDVKRIYKIQKIKGHKRLVLIGYTHTVKLC